MSRKDFESCRGFSLIEMLIAVVVSGILIAGLSRFFKDSHSSYNLQEEITDRDQNAHYVVKRLTEVLMEAGANLPNERWAVIVPHAAIPGRLWVSSNPRGGSQVIPVTITNLVKVPVDDERGFRKANSILVEYADKARAIRSFPINRNYNRNGFVQGVKAMADNMDTLYLSTPVSLVPGDVVYALSHEEFRLQGTELLKGGMVLAENIDSLSVTFFGQDMAPTLDWTAMKSAKLTVTARTRTREPNLPRDGYRRITLSMNLRLRNRL